MRREGRDEWGVCCVGKKCPDAETCDLGGEKINKKRAYETLQESINVSAIVK